VTTDPTAGPAGRLPAAAEDLPAFARLLGIRIVSAERDRVVAEFVVTSELGNRNGVLHGGAVMGIADALGGTATFLNLPEGTSTTTIESKTNFFAAIGMGETARAETTPLHRGRTTQVWQTRISRGDGKLAALVTQTQIVMGAR
jgi:1,4-dihydroxy-2-naphthoyl-CoA hydrolase